MQRCDFFDIGGGLLSKTIKRTFKKGVHFDDKKELTRNLPIEEMPLMDDYYVGLSQHIGIPAIALVQAGEHVDEGQLIAKAGGFVSANVFAPVSGKVIGIEKRKNNLGIQSDFIHIKRSEGNVLTLPPIDQNNPKEIKQRILDAGIVGLGGAGFPTHVKISPQKPVDTLIVNAAECESYLNCDNRLMLEYTREVVEGAKLIAKSVEGINKIVIGIEENKPRAYELLKQQTDVEIVLLKKKYPQGGEKQLIFACTKRKVPTKGLPMDVGVVVQNVATCFAVYQAVVLNKPLYSRVMTVSGLGINNPKNLLVRNGTLYKDILSFCGGIKRNTQKLIAGGPMMGIALSDDNGVTSKTDSGLLALLSEEANITQPSACINCARCAKVCPMNLMPMYIDFYTLAGDYKTAVKYGAEHCIECGCCAYSCPAKRTIVQSVKLCKAKLKEKK